MQSHSELGANAIEAAETDIEHDVEFLTLAKEIARHHHERWDGSGYPDGLSGEAIPLSARLMALADVFDALISPRVYKEPMSFADAKEIIIDEKNKHFDPMMVNTFHDCFDQFVDIATRHASGVQ